MFNFKLVLIEHVSPNLNTSLKHKVNFVFEGLSLYDKRKGWQGPLTNIKKYKKNWIEDLENYKLEKSINWKLAIVKKVNKFSTIIETEDNKKGSIEYSDISWTKKEFDEIFKIGDVIYVKKIDNNYFSLKQLPKTNGASKISVDGV